MDYRVELDDYSGPLDLLLYLIKGEEVDIYGIPISRIADRYVEHLEGSPAIDINNVAEFLLMASRLMEIKSRKLTRKPESEEDEDEEEGDEEDPSAELFRQLLALRAFKEAATLLSELADIRARQFTRGGRIELPDEEPDADALPLTGVSLFDLADRYARLLSQTGADQATIEKDEISVEERTEAIMGALERRPELALRAFLEESRSRAAIVGTFFVVLELVWRGGIRVYQSDEFGEIFVTRRAEGDAADEGGAGGDKEQARPSSPHVEPYLPPPVERGVGPDGRPLRGPLRVRFAGVDRPDEPPDQTEQTEDDFVATDNFEARLKARIDRILALADRICESFEASLRSRGQPAGDAGAAAPPAADLDAELAAFRDELGPEEADLADAPSGEGSAADATDSPPGEAPENTEGAEDAEDVESQEDGADTEEEGGADAP